MRKLLLFRVGLMALVCGLACSGCARIFTPTAAPYGRPYVMDDTIEPDSSIIAYYMPYKQQLEAEMNRVVGRTEVALTKPGNVPETLLGNFFADALLEEGKRLEPRAQLSFGTKDGLRRELGQGDITIGDLFELMPFENELVVLELSAGHIERLAQFVAARNGQPLAGLTLVIRDGQPHDIRVAGAPLHPDSTYFLVTYDYLANGGDNLRALENPVSRHNLGKKVRESLIDYVARHSENNKTIHAKIEGRITTD